MRAWFSITTLLLTMLCLVSRSAAGKSIDDPIVEVPFAFEAGHVIVQAKIKNDVPVALILSTGAEHSSFDSGLMLKYKLPAYYTGVGVITGHNDQIVTFTTVPDIRIGGLHQSSLNMRLVSLDALTKRLGHEIAGILGIDFFKGRTVQFDFANKILRFLPKSEADSTIKSSGATRRSVFAMSYLKNQLAVPIVEDLTIQGKKFKTLFDTGAVTVVSLSASAAKQLGLSPPPDKGPPRPDKVTYLRLSADEEIPDLPVMVYAKGSDFDRDELDFAAVVGTVFLKNFNVTFDFRKKIIVLER